MDKLEVLRQYFGHSAFRSGQSEIIDNILNGRDVLGIMPTGAGKSICYQVPAMLLDGITIVISPLISLMKDQVEALVQSGVPAAFINSSLTYRQYLEVFRRASEGAYKLIYVAPERLVADEFIAFAEGSRIAMVTVDEAHCVSQWGQDFRPSYLKITEFISRLSYRPIVSAFTATATAEVRADISAILHLNDPFVITTGFDRQNLYFEVQRPARKLDALMEILDRNRDRCCIVYCLTRKNVEAVCLKLEERGFSATRYHAGLSEAERHANQEDFICDRKNIMVATNAFGMGIDKSNVSLVVHYNMPGNLESYYQEAGRAGRDGEPASCILLYSGQDVMTNKFLIERSGEENEELDPRLRGELKKRDLDRLSQMTFYSTTSGCLRGFILKYFGENPTSFCGNCSNCCGGFEKTDITVEAQKIISCVYRIYNMNGGSVGRAVLADILHGSRSERITRMGYDRLTTYGIMSDVPPRRIRAVIDHLVEENYLGTTGGEYPVLTLTEGSALVIKEKPKLEMRLPAERKAAAPKKKETAEPADSGLFGRLKALRREFADREGVPAYVIFSDASLRDMCSKLPENEEEFLGVSGVGAKKCRLYGEAFLEAINGNAEKAREGDPWTETEDDRLRLEYDKGFSVMSMSEAHGRNPDDIRVRLKKLGIIRKM